MRERHPDERRRQCAEAVQQVVGIEGGRDRLPGQRRLDRLGRLRVVPLTGLQNDLPLAEVEPDRPLYLAVPAYAYDGIFQEPIGQLIIRQERLQFVVFDEQQERIRQWIP